MADFSEFPKNTNAPAAIEELAEQIGNDGGSAMAAFQGRLVSTGICSLCGRDGHADTVSARPFARDMKRLTEVMKKLGRYAEPIAAVRVGAGEYWTPNGNHPRAAAIKAGAKLMAIVIPEANVAWD